MTEGEAGALREIFVTLPVPELLSVPKVNPWNSELNIEFNKAVVTGSHLYLQHGIVPHNLHVKHTQG